MNKRALSAIVMIFTLFSLLHADEPSIVSENMGTGECVLVADWEDHANRPLLYLAGKSAEGGHEVTVSPAGGRSQFWMLYGNPRVGRIVQLLNSGSSWLCCSKGMFAPDVASLGMRDHPTSFWYVHQPDMPDDTLLRHGMRIALMSKEKRFGLTAEDQTRFLGRANPDVSILTNTGKPVWYRIYKVGTHDVTFGSDILLSSDNGYLHQEMAFSPQSLHSSLWRIEDPFGVRANEQVLLNSTVVTLTAGGRRLGVEEGRLVMKPSGAEVTDAEKWMFVTGSEAAPEVATFASSARVALKSMSADDLYLGLDMRLGTDPAPKFRIVMGIPNPNPAKQPSEIFPRPETIPALAAFPPPPPRDPIRYGEKFNLIAPNHQFLTIVEGVSIPNALVAAILSRIPILKDYLGRTVDLVDVDRVGRDEAMVIFDQDGRRSTDPVRFNEQCLIQSNVGYLRTDPTTLDLPAKTPLVGAMRLTLDHPLKVAGNWTPTDAPYWQIKDFDDFQSSEALYDGRRVSLIYSRLGRYFKYDPVELDLKDFNLFWSEKLRVTGGEADRHNLAIRWRIKRVETPYRALRSGDTVALKSVSAQGFLSAREEWPTMLAVLRPATVLSNHEQFTIEIPASDDFSNDGTIYYNRTRIALRTASGRRFQAYPELPSGHPSRGEFPYAPNRPIRSFEIGRPPGPLNTWQLWTVVKVDDENYQGEVKYYDRIALRSAHGKYVEVGQVFESKIGMIQHKNSTLGAAGQWLLCDESD